MSIYEAGDGLAPESIESVPGVFMGPSMRDRFYGFYSGDPCGFGTFPIAAAATSLKVPDAAASALISVEVSAIRVTFDGTGPTAAVGVLIPAGTLLKLTGRATLQGFQAFQAAAGAVVQAAFFD